VGLTHHKEVLHSEERLYSMDEALEIIERLDSYTSQCGLTPWVGLTQPREVLVYRWGLTHHREV